MLGFDRIILVEAFIQKYLSRKGRRAFAILLLAWILGKRLYMRIIARMKRKFPFYPSSYLTKRTKEFIEKRSKEILLFSSLHADQCSPETTEKVLNAKNIRELITAIENDELTCEQIVRVYALRAAEFSLRMNHLADVDLANAIEEAKLKDANKNLVMQKNGGHLPFLYGIPIAVKDHITAKNMLSTMALQARLVDQLDGKIYEHDFQRSWKTPSQEKNEPLTNQLQPEQEEEQKQQQQEALPTRSEENQQSQQNTTTSPISLLSPELTALKPSPPDKTLLCTKVKSKYGNQDAEIVRVLREMGAIVMCMTNTPVFCGHYITNNSMFGFAQNPYQPHRTTGGSSGGSGGIVATRSVPLAIGSDLLGSTRMPSGWCGLYGFNPTSRRISKSGAQGFELRFDCDVSKTLMPIFGPMGKCVDDLVDCMRGLYGKFTKDKQCVPMVFDEKMFTGNRKKMRFGVVRKDEAVGYGNFNKNLIEECAIELAKIGHEVVDFDLTEKMWHMEYLSKKLFLGSQEKHMMLNELRGERSTLGVELGLIANELPDTFRIAGKTMLRASGEELAADALDCLGEIKGREFDLLLREREVLKKQFYDYWQSLDLDALILPISYAWAPRRHEEGFVACRFHGCLTNCLELPCGTIPIRYATVQDEGFDFEFSKKNRMMKTLIRKNLQGIAGMPIGLQIAALPFEDEKCLHAMKVLESIFQFFPHAC